MSEKQQEQILDIIVRIRPFEFAGQSFLQIYTISEDKVDNYGKTVKQVTVPNIVPYNTYKLGDPIDLRYDRTKKQFYVKE